MASLKIPPKNQKRLLVLIGATVVIVVILYFGVIRSPGPPPPEIQPTSRRAVPEVKATLLETKTLDQFKVWNSLPIEVGPTGKENPFSK